eukprot:TRINITY_DN4796_c0_g1_i2.p1 TRINITY_DN4796_c0_g1~~TRINITY_DN4796_c0_g1_i2.p1  ORF type:complete len:197 (-),score=-26.30 TRINITY_DN4796_c0_g1_i2:235-765(-)
MLYLILLLINYALTPQTSQFIFIIFIDTKKLHLLIEKLLDVTINQNKPRIYKHEKQGRHINFNTKIRTTHKYTIMLINTQTTICICKQGFFKLGQYTYLVKILHHIQSFLYEPILFPFYKTYCKRKINICVRIVDIFLKELNTAAQYAGPQKHFKRIIIKCICTLITCHYTKKNKY